LYVLYPFTTSVNRFAAWNYNYNTWTLLTTAVPNSGPMVQTSTNNIIVIGGFAGTSSATTGVSTVTQYNTSANNITSLASISDGTTSFALTGHSVVAVGDYVYVFGGFMNQTSATVSTANWRSKTLRYQISTNTWSQLSAAPVTFGLSSATLMSNGNILVGIPITTTGAINLWYVYNPNTDAWTQADSPSGYNLANNVGGVSSVTGAAEFNTGIAPQGTPWGSKVLVWQYTQTGANSVAWVFNPSAAAGSQWSTVSTNVVFNSAGSGTFYALGRGSVLPNGMGMLAVIISTTIYFFEVYLGNTASANPIVYAVKN